MTSNENSIKIVLCGGTFTGRSSLLRQYTLKQFHYDESPTIGAAYFSKKMIVGSQLTNVAFWDTTGLERCIDTVMLYVKGINCCILVYDVTDTSSFKSLEFWYKAILDHLKSRDEIKTTFVCIGNKIDLENDIGLRNLVREWCRHHGYIPYFECSAKANINVNEAFQAAIDASIRHKSLFSVDIPPHIKATLDKGNTSKILQLLNQYRLSNRSNIKTISTILDEIIEKNNEDVINALRLKAVTEEEITDFVFKSGKISDRSYRLLNECLLYRSIRQENGRYFEILCSADVANSCSLFMGRTVLETVAEYGRVLYMKLLLQKLMRIDVSWVQAKDIALTNGFDKIESMISKRQQYIELQKHDGYNRLHIAVFDNDPEMVKYILENNLVDPDNGENTVGTPLSHAYYCKFIECIKVFEEKRVNINTVDNKKQTSLSVALGHGMGDFCQYLLDNVVDINARDHMGLTILERAVIGGCESVCATLLKKGASYVGKIHIYPHWLISDPNLSLQMNRPCLNEITHDDTIVSLCIKTNGLIFPTLLNTLNEDNINEQIEDENTLLHLASKLLLPKVCVALLERGAQVDVLNNKSYTPLFMLLDSHKCNPGEQKKEDKLIETVNCLLGRGASINIEGSDGYTLFGKATLCFSERLLMTLVESAQELNCLAEPQLETWLQYRYIDLLTLSLPKINRKLLRKWIKREVIDCSMTVASMSLTTALLDHADESVYSNSVERVLYKAAMINDEKLFLKLINTNISKDSRMNDGDSLLHCLIREKKICYCRLVLRSSNASLLVEKKNSANKLPLHICIESDVNELIDSLIIETKGVDEEDNNGYTPLSMLLEKISDLNEECDVDRAMYQIKAIINKNVDIYKVNRFNKMIISFCANLDLQSRIKCYYHRQLPVNKAGNSTDEIMICRICRDNRIDCVFECGHTFCMTCGQQLYPCPMCRYAPTNPRLIRL